MSEKKIPHVHAECIKAWADGATIQYKHNNIWHDHMGDGSPAWSPGWEYRVKPEPKPDVIVFQNYYSNRGVGYPNATLQLAQHGVDKSVKPLGTLKLTFDGETGKLKSAEAL